MGDTDQEDELRERFIREIEERGGEVLEEIGGDVFRVRLVAGEAVVSLDNLRREVTQSGDLDAVGRFVSTFARVPRGLPDWPDAEPGLRWAFESAEVDVGTTVHEAATRQLVTVLCYTDAHEELVTMLHASKLTGWGIDVGRAKEIALANMDALLAATEIVVDDVRGHPLGMLSTHSVFKASLLLAPSLKARVEEDIGWPLLAVVPCRDFAYLFADDSLVSPMGSTVIREYRDSAYPLSTELLRISDDGIEALGAFGPPPADAS